ncbi:MAG: hypothetical protein WC728_08355 [Elusimicrobiota bacterium]
MTWLLMLLLLPNATCASPKKKPQDPLEVFRRVGPRENFRNDRMRALLDVPAGYQRIAPKRNPDIRYQFAFKHKKARFEVRIHFMPLAEDPERARERVECERRNRKEPGSCVMADLEAPSEAWGDMIRGNMGSHGPMRYFPFPADGVKKEFAADWGYVSTPFELSAEHPFNAGYKLGQITVLNRRGVGKMVRIVLTDGIEGFKFDRPIFYSARFDGADPPGP